MFLVSRVISTFGGNAGDSGFLSGGLWGLEGPTGTCSADNPLKRCQRETGPSVLPGRPKCPRVLLLPGRERGGRVRLGIGVPLVFGEVLRFLPTPGEGSCVPWGSPRSRTAGGTWGSLSSGLNPGDSTLSSDRGSSRTVLRYWDPSQVSTRETIGSGRDLGPHFLSSVVSALCLGTGSHSGDNCTLRPPSRPQLQDF